MASSPPRNRLTPLQRDLIDGFFAREHRFFLTGGGALAGYWIEHRTTEDIDLFSTPGVDLRDASATISDVAREVGGKATQRSTHLDFHRLLVERGDERCVVDLVVDRAPVIDETKAMFGDVRVDTLREIAANKVTTLISRSEIKDLIDLLALVRLGVDLERAFADARRKDASAEPATLAWILEQITIGPEAPLPGGFDPADVLAARDDLVRKLRADAFAEATRKR